MIAIIQRKEITKLDQDGVTLNSVKRETKTNTGNIFQRSESSKLHKTCHAQKFHIQIPPC